MQLSESEFLAICKEMYSSMSSQMDSESQDFYTYESELDKLIQDLGRKVLESSLGSSGLSSRKKKRYKRDLGQ